jgi:hypothetical protein
MILDRTRFLSDGSQLRPRGESSHRESDNLFWNAWSFIFTPLLRFVT